MPGMDSNVGARSAPVEETGLRLSAPFSLCLAPWPHLSPITSLSRAIFAGGALSGGEPVSRGCSGRLPARAHALLECASCARKPALERRETFIAFSSRSQVLIAELEAKQVCADGVSDARCFPSAWPTLRPTLAGVLCRGVSALTGRLADAPRASRST